MGKVSYSALVNTIRGRVNFSVMSAWRGINYIKRHNPGPRQPHTAKQQLVRGLLSTLAGDYYSLTAAQKELWNKYASLLKQPMSGINAYVKNNALMLRNSIVATAISGPPPTPDTPDRLVGHTLTTGAGRATLSWTAPNSATLFVLLQRSVLAGLDDGSHPRWTTVGVTTGSILSLGEAHGFPTGVILRYKAAVVDVYGRISPYTEMMERFSA